MDTQSIAPTLENEVIINSPSITYGFSKLLPSKPQESISIEELSPEDQERVTARGYTLRREIGEGQGSTRRAFYATKKDGNLERDVVLKIPRREKDITSMNSQINLSKKNRDLQEALLSGKLRHSHIVRIADSFQLSDGRTVNAEDFIDGWSVRSLVKTTGPVSDRQRLRNMFSPLIDALAYTHEQGVLHRDITPSNVLVPSQGEGAVLTDWQMAAYVREIENVAIPTRGGTSCTHPILLNGLMNGTPSRATERTDIYSLGAVLYEAITGDPAFDYSLVANPNGKKLQINGKELSVGLKSKGQDLESITFEDHESRLKEAMKKVPRELRQLLYGMMTTKPGKEIYSMKKVREEFLDKTKPGKEERLEKLLRYGRTAVLTAVGGFAGILAAYMGLMMESNQQHQSKQPTLSDILRTQSSIQSYVTGNFADTSAIKSGAMRTEFDIYQK